MKRNASPIIIALASLMVFIIPVVGVADDTMSKEVNSNNIYQHKTPDARQSTDTTIKKNDKKILIEESREMSTFFKIGIAINIIMILVFSWWFRKEWRGKK